VLTSLACRYDVPMQWENRVFDWRVHTQAAQTQGQEQERRTRWIAVGDGWTAKTAKKKQKTRRADGTANERENGDESPSWARW
jgi:hypothetical protein